MILTLARRGVLSHKRRLVGLCSAVAIGVAFLVGTLVLGDTMRSSFDQIFSATNAGIDAIVQGKPVVSSASGAQPANVPDRLVGALRDVEGVAKVQPMVEGIAQIVGSDGKPIAGGGGPTFGGNWVDDPTINPQRIATGAPPTADNEVVIDAASARTGNIAIGDRITLLTPDPVRLTVTGLTKYGDADSMGVSYAGLTFAAASEHLGKPGTLTSVVMQAQDGVSPDDLVARIAPLLPRNVEALTGDQFTQQLNEQVQAGFLNFFQIFLTVFAAIALIVATFSIYNTFSVIAAQKSRESALLRAIGASRRQVLGAIAGESMLIGVLAAALGLLLGIGVAAGLIALLDALGTGLPNTGLAISPGSLLTGFIVGVLVTIVAAIMPSIRAARVAPLAALRDVAVERPTAITLRFVLGLTFIVVGVAVLGSLLFAQGNELWRVGIGSAAAFVGFIVIGPAAARPTARVLGAPIARLRGVSGQMARANAARNPRRTANTATALMVGVAVVSMFTIFAGSIKAAITGNMSESLSAGLVLANNSFSGAGYDPRMVARLDQLPEVATVATLDPTQVLIDGSAKDVNVATMPALGEVADLGDGVTLRDGELAVDEQTASDLGWQQGRRIEVGLPDGSTESLTVGAVYTGNTLVTGVLVPRSVYDKAVANPGIYTVLVKLAPGVAVADAQRAAQAVADEYSAGTVQTRTEFADATAGQIDQLLGIIYALLILAIIIALMGIANTLSLSVFERTRELGLLRAVGQTRPQARSMVRWESVIIAVFGTFGGIALGGVLGGALFAAVSSASGLDTNPQFGVGSLVAIAVVGAAVGLLAGLRPAARAAKLNVLAAIATE